MPNEKGSGHEERLEKLLGSVNSPKKLRPMVLSPIWKGEGHRC